jgi:hypothetical protein
MHGQINVKCILLTQVFITLFTRAHQFSQSWARFRQVNGLTTDLFLTSILLLSSHLFLRFPL